ncbi:MAG: POT family MFS transporter [Ignavibacteria bacterium]|nr:POT family MFS transporter [Ignavibacteria bacterium]
MTETSQTEIKKSDKYPKGIPYIIWNEFAERFNFYAMKAILVVFMTKYLIDMDGNLAPMTDVESRSVFHLFGMANYFFPMLGAIISDIFWGKYKTILRLSVVYMIGSLLLAVDHTRLGLTLGLTLIAIGSGGIKPCVSSNVGDQFGASQKHLLSKIFGIFYFAVNLGSLSAAILSPILLDKFGPNVAFGLPGFLMFLAVFIFWLGRNKFVKIEPVSPKQYFKDIKSPQGRKAILNLALLYIFIAIFWSLFDQKGSAWILQARDMNRNIDLVFFQFSFLESQINVINPLLVLILIPVFNSVIYPFFGKFFKITPLRKIGTGLFLSGFSFIFIAIAQIHIDASPVKNVVPFAWQIPAFILITCGEVLVSVTGLEFSYTQAPNSMKSIIMGLWSLAVSFGNLVTALTNIFIVQIGKVITKAGKIFISDPEWSFTLGGSNYFFFFAILTLLTAVIFVFFAQRYKEESYIQVQKK